jgi:two-component sensor histidine kinase
MNLASLNTEDQAVFGRVARSLTCYEGGSEESLYAKTGEHSAWIRKAAPLIAHPWGRPWWKPWTWFTRRYVGALFTIHDATEERQKEQERRIQAAMVQEIHHRVKNNLQTVAALLRMERRRAKYEETRRILEDCESRVLSMAVVHEYLSRSEGQSINIREVAQRIIKEIRQGVIGPDKQIEVVLQPGNSLYLPARQTTACALVINELLQNAVEHGFAERESGRIAVWLEDEGDAIEIAIKDDGEGLPPGFDLSQTGSLGLQIVRTLVNDDLKGSFGLEGGAGATATIRFSKKVWEDE